MAFMFENLQVYQKAVDMADRITGLAESFPRGYYFLIDQLNRAALSVATNLAEGNGRFTKPDRKNFFGVARGSVQWGRRVRSSFFIFCSVGCWFRIGCRHGQAAAHRDTRG